MLPEIYNKCSKATLLYILEKGGKPKATSIVHVLVVIGKGMAALKANHLALNGHSEPRNNI